MTITIERRKFIAARAGAAAAWPRPSNGLVEDVATKLEASVRANVV